MLRAILILPFNVTVTMPALLLWFTQSLATAGPASIQFWLALVFLSLGVPLIVKGEEKRH